MRMVKAGEIFVEFAAISLLSIGHAVAASTGQVRTADNKPVAGAVVTILNGGDNQNAKYASLQGTELKDTSGRSVSATTDDLGHFQLPDHKPGALLVVTGPAGFAAMPTCSVLRSGTWVRLSSLGEYCPTIAQTRHFGAFARILPFRSEVP